MASKRTFPIQQNKELARRVPEDIATEGDFDLVEEVYTEDAVEHGPMGTVRGRAVIREQLEAFLGAFEDFSVTVEDVIAEGDMVAMRVTLRGTHVGDFLGVAATDREFEVSNLVLTRVDDGRIAERWVIPDMVTLYRQLGLETLPSPPAD